MMNDHVVHLAALVEVGTVVKVMDHLPDPDDLASLPWTATAKPAAFGTAGRPAGD
jgi:hypothetical protein